MPGRIQPPRHKKLKDRTEENILGAARKPHVTKHNAVLKCEVEDAFPKPQLQWQDSTGNIVPAEKPQVTERGGRYDVILQTTVTKTDTYRCVVTQKEINHQVYYETDVTVPGFSIGWVIGVGVVCFLVGFGAAPSIRWYKKRRRRQNDQDVSEPMKP